ncbi:MAG: CIA30 family protein [Pseudomonadota bacterium]
MKLLKKIFSIIFHGFVFAVTIASAGAATASNLEPLVDDFSDSKTNSMGVARQFLNDSMTGGGTTMSPSVSNGILSVSGQISPARGQPGWASSVLLFDPAGQPVDASSYEGVRLRIKVSQGMLSVSANSTDVVNFDYHAALIVVKADGEFHDVKVPFASMRRAWSEQTTLDTSTIASLSIVAFDMQPGAYDFEVDEVGFY